MSYIRTRNIGLITAACVCATFSTPQVLAQSEGANDTLEEIIAIGTRSTRPRSASDSPVPIDVLNADDLSAMGNTVDLTDSLKALIPSYNATPATGDGSAFIRPTSLRGTAPDQVLVLVNGKRRHRSALVQFFAPAAGNGAHGVDIGMIPSIALKRVEVLRDGAASQYGSDAIAGVINFVTKDAAEGGALELQYGEFYDGEQSFKAAANGGMPLGDVGFINASFEYFDNDALSRGIQRPDAQALINAGVQGVGADAPFGDEPLTQSWGRPQSEGLRLYVNSAVEVGENAELYARIGYADTDGRYRFFYRPPNHASLMTLRAQGFTGLPGGYTPFLDGAQEDLSVVGGLEGEFNSGMYYDFSASFGQNELNYFLNNTTNPSLGVTPGPIPGIPQRDFVLGGYKQKEVTLNADFSQAIRDNLNLGFGGEWREETYSAIAGEPASYFGSGSNGFKGITPQDAGNFSRDNWSVYADLEHDISDRFLLQYAARYEDYSDFGDTLNGKIAARFDVSDRVALRGAVSTGFHAPTPGQTNVRTTITTFDGATGLQVEEGLIPSTDPRVAAVGGTALTEETSLNFSAGFTADIGENSNLTVDVYKIEVDDRIYRTGDIAVPGSTNTISFYTNALDVEHTGLDLVFTSNFDWSGTASSDLSFIFSYNEIEVVNQKQINGVNPVNDGLVEDIENNYPNERFVISLNTYFSEDWNLMLRGNYYGKHYDERGRIGAAVDPSFEIGTTFYIDAELGWQVNDNFRLAAGGVNITDEFVDEIGPGFSNLRSSGLQYSRRTAANYEGGSWYLRGSYSW
jgi:iron complex outermembrane receptor protein